MNVPNARVAGLTSEQKRRLLKELLRQKASQSGKTYPLSYNQRPLWFIQQMAPASHAYNISFAARVLCQVDVPALRRAFQNLIDRHPSLRTGFDVRDGEPVQKVYGSRDARVEQIDASGFSDETLESHVNAAHRQSFALTDSAVMRVALFTRSNADHALIVTVHHVVFDGWSSWLVLDELQRLYAAESRGQRITLPTPAFQYSDFVRWQADMLAGPHGERLETFWRQELAGATVLEMPTDFPRPSGQSFRGATTGFEIDNEMTRRIKALAEAQGVTLFMVLVAAYQVLMHRYSGQEDILVGSPTSGRTRPEFAGVVGCFVNPVVLRAQVQGTVPFTGFLAQVRRMTLAALDHQDYPFHLMAQRHWHDHSPSHHPLFQVEFNLLKPQKGSGFGNLFFPDGARRRIVFGGLQLENLPLSQQAGQVDLTLEMIEVEGALLGDFKYNTDLFAGATIQRMAGHFRALLGGIVAAPNTTVADLPILTAGERQQFIGDWSVVRTQLPDEPECVHHMFEAQVARTPDALALVSGAAHLTYREINARANQLAHRLKALGVGCDTLVGVSIDRSPDLIVALLGILKSGGAYVPLDPAYPEERLAYMIADTRPRVLVTLERLVEKFADHQAAVLCIDADWDDISSEPACAPGNETGLGDLSYVIYTSGSTGNPKGVMIEHRSLARFTQAMGEEIALGPGDRLLQFSSINFDTSAEEIFPCLANGATLVLRNEAMLDSVREFLRCCEDWGITVLDLPTAYWHELVSESAADWFSLPNSIRLLIIGGEAAAPERLRAWRTTVGSKIRLLNTYGPTEATVAATSCDLTPGDERSDDGRIVPIGRPIPGVRAYVLDNYLQPVPVGVPGELYIGGDCLARGYLNRPELTTARFLSDPFQEDAHARVYKTGDRVRLLADGSIEYLGRTDHQVKIRGFRVELGEIEAVLLRETDVTEAAVVLREDMPGGKGLVAYVCASPGSNPSIQHLREHLRISLPEFMMPAIFCVLERFPRTPNGKLDRKALPVPDAEGRNRDNDFGLPRDPLQQMLAGIWEAVLGLDEVDVEANFFELGGHSLLAMQVMARIREDINVELPVRSLFEAPTLAELARRIAAELGAGHSHQAPPLRQLPRAEQTPLSFSQERLWFADQLEPGAAAYNLPSAVRLRGILDPLALQRSLTEILRRHEALRTCFGEADGEPVQVIRAPAPCQLPLVEIEAETPAEREREVSRQLAGEARRPFELAKGPLLRALLLRLGAREHVLMVTMHHIVSDGWSMSVLVRELGALYNAYSTGTPPALAELDVQYADYAQWQRQWLRGELLQTQLSYWKRQLDGAPSALQLPCDRTRPPVQTYRGALQRLTFSAALTAGLHSLSRAQGCTLFMTLLATFKVLLSRYTGERDIVVGTPIAGRTSSELEALIGVFVNNLVLRTNLDGNPSFVELLSRVREVALGAYAHQDLPFEVLVEALQPERDASRHPLFQVLFAVQNAPMPPLELNGLILESLPIEWAASQFDLTLYLWEDDDRLVGVIEYNTDLFDASSIERMAGHFGMLLEEVARNPEQRLTTLPLLQASERQRMLVEWNRTAGDYPRESCVHRLFEEQARRRPAAPAVIADDGALSYSGLEARSNRLARYLRGLGVGPGKLVALCMSRSTRMLVGLLGVLKAGGAYVPIDPCLPRERVAFMLQDAAPRVVLTKASLADELPGNDNSLRICIDRDWGVIEREGSGPLGPCFSPENLAYVIYTSGSTGTPKGVEIEHRAVVNLLHAMGRHTGIVEGDTLVAVTTLSFDIAALELFLPLAAGAKVVVAGRDSAMDGRLLQDLMADAGATMMQATPATWRMLLESGWTCERGLKALCGGEPLSPELAQALLATGASVWNLYGPTETTIWSAVQRLQSATGPIPIGRPIANTQMFVLDADRLPVPVGVAGELYIGGVGLARGYLNQTGLTAERFVETSFVDGPDQRLYRTGDRVRYRADGSLEYLGRTDFQVKVRGFRIEPGEIEAVLARHAGVRGAVVVVREDVPGDQRLVAYLLTSEPTPDPRELVALLRMHVPDYMVPAAFVSLDSFPMTANNKVDRKALPAPAWGVQAPEQVHVAPANPIEELVAGIWATALKLDRVGRMDNFFDLGGHSLLATRVVASIRESVGVDIPLRSLFEAPTVAALVEYIDAARCAGPAVEVSELRSMPHTDHPPLSFAQQRLWFLHQLDPDSIAFNVVGVVRLTGRLDQGALSRSLTEIQRRHQSLRTVIVERDGEPIQVVIPADACELKVRDLDGSEHPDPEQVALQAAAAEAYRSFDLARGPLLRCALLCQRRDQHMLVLTMHHIVADGWSIGVLLRELATLYNAFVAGQPSPLRDLVIQYADFAQWQRQWMQGPVVDDQLRYWKQQLSDAPPVLELPSDRVRPPVQTYRGSQLPFLLSKSLTDDLVALSREAGATLFMTLLGAFKVLLARYTGQQDIVVGSPIAGRNRSEVDDLIGVFINNLVLRTDLSGNPSFRTLLRRVREVSLGAYAHQDLPFEMLVKELQPERDMSHHPLFQVMMVLQNIPVPSFELTGLCMEPVEIDWLAAQLDLNLSLWETPQGLAGAMQFNTDIFDRETVERLLGHYTTLLEGIVAAPDSSLSELPMLSEAERQQILVAWNDTGQDYDGDGGVHRLIEAQAERAPTAVAVTCGSVYLTYDELNRRANQLAHYLTALGVGPEVVVGIAFDRSLDAIVCVLAVHKAGGAYLPLDLDYPLERLRFMLADAGASIVLSRESECVGDLGPDVREIIVDAAWEFLSGESPRNPVAPPAAGDLAYVIYTSGSTGRPKGVMITHRNLMSSTMARVAYYREPVDTLLLLSSMSFDSSVAGIFWTLCQGGTLLVPTSPQSHDVRSIETLIAEQRVSHLLAVPSLYWMLLETSSAEHLASLRTVIVAGEACPWELSRYHYNLVSKAPLFNEYGPTEATVWVTVQKVSEAGPGVHVPIGRPIANTQLFVLDDYGQPVPVGVAGELYIGGAGVARGYVNRPELTSQRFVEDVFSAQTGARLYRTGDRVRYLADGTVEFLGRVDHQVKLRGFRIEPGEIEAALGAHPIIREAVVAVRTDSPGDQRLVAYLLPVGDAEPVISELRTYLRARVPEYMVPSAFVVLKSFPLTPNNKLDRDALPAPTPGRAVPEGALEAPRTPIEELIANIWKELLEIDQVGCNDNFFDLGGHSILSMRVVANLERAIGVRINPGELIFQTLGQLAIACEERLGDVPKQESRAGVLDPLKRGLATLRKGRLGDTGG